MMPSSLNKRRSRILAFRSLHFQAKKRAHFSEFYLAKLWIRNFYPAYSWRKSLPSLTPPHLCLVSRNVESKAAGTARMKGPKNILTRYFRPPLIESRLYTPTNRKSFRIQSERYSPKVEVLNSTQLFPLG